MAELNSIESIINPGNAVQTTEVSNTASVYTTMTSGNQVITTHNTVPQVKTVIVNETREPITTIIYGDWDVVWSVNGQTGDVLIDVVLGNFTANTTYTKNAIISYNNKLYKAKNTFTSGQTFNASDWDELSVVGTSTASTFIANHQYTKNEMVYYSDDLYLAKNNFTSGATFNPNDWNVVGGSGGAFIAEYGVTTFADILAAINDGLAVFCRKDTTVSGISQSVYVPITRYDSNGVILFGGVIAFGTYSSFRVNTNNVWATPVDSDNFLVTAAQSLTSQQKTQVQNNIGLVESGYVIDANYVHTDNNYTTTEKTKLSGIEAGAQKNIANTVIDANYVHTDNNYTNADKADVAEIDGIMGKIPTQASSSNQLADKNFVNSSINSVTAYYITKNAQGAQFSTKAELDSTTIFYSGGEVRIPTRNDYCIVLEDETKTDPITSEKPTTRYIYQNSGWEFQYIVNKTTLTAVQLAALNSNITAQLTTKLQGISAGAEVNTIDGIQVGGEDLPISNKKVNIPIADASNLGAIKATQAFGVEVSDNGELKAKIYTYPYYPGMWNDAFISKGTLENVITGKNLISDASYVHTDNNYTSAEKQKLANTPTVNNSSITITQGGVAKGSFTTNQSSPSTINIDATPDNVTLWGTGSVEPATPWADTTEIVDKAVTGDKLHFPSIFNSPISWSTASVTVATAWAQNTIFAARTVTGLVANATYLLLCSCGLFYKPDATASGDMIFTIGTNTSGATVSNSQDYNIGGAYSPRIIGTLTTGSNTSVSIYGSINTATTGTFQINGCQVYLIRIR